MRKKMAGVVLVLCASFLLTAIPVDTVASSGEFFFKLMGHGMGS